MKLSDLKIATRIYLGFGVLAGMTVLMVAISYANFARLATANDMNLHTYEVLGEVDAVTEALVNTETGQRGYALTGDDASLQPYQAGKQAFREHLDKALALTADNAAQQERLKLLGQLQGNWLAQAIDPVIALRRASVDDKVGEVVAFVQQGKGKAGMDAMRSLLTEIGKAETVLLEQRRTEALGLQKSMSRVLIGGGILSVLMAGFMAFQLMRSISVPLRRAVKLARQVAEGDLSAEVQVRSRDETGELMGALKDMNASLVAIVSEVRGGTERIEAASTEISAGNQDLSSRTEQQAGSLEETASSMEELTSTVKQNADNARQANQLAASAAETATRGGAVVSEVVTTMGSINESARKIVDIIGVIDSIAFQTNILALNAAVEAARAGEQGRGFAVVAGEVSYLAQRSANAAKEIKELIGDSVSRVEAGSRLVDQAGRTMDEVVASVRRVSDIIGEISAASDEQRSGIEQVNQAIVQMDHVTQQNAALVEQAAAAAEAMREQAGGLSQLVGTFKLAHGQEALAAPVARKALPGKGQRSLAKAA